MEGNMKMKTFKSYVKNIAFFLIFLFQEHLSRIKIYIRHILKITLYELWKDIQLNISYFHPFGCECFILNIMENLGKFDPKLDKGTFLRYSNASKYTKNLIIEESMHVKFNGSKPNNEFLELNDFITNLNLKDLQTLSKEPVALVSKVEPKSIDNVLIDEGWIKAKLVSLPKEKSNIGIDFIETFAPIAKREVICILLLF
ncbi:hypothetical protein CR513_05320, partial [Mucuna pruriens]